MGGNESPGSLKDVSLLVNQSISHRDITYFIIKCIQFFKRKSKNIKIGKLHIFGTKTVRDKELFTSKSNLGGTYNY